MLKRGDLVSQLRRDNRRGGVLPVLLALVAMATAATAASATETEAGGNVTVEVVNALTGQSVPELQVTAKRRIGDEFEWIARHTTDSEGRAEFSLEGVEEGVPYVFFATPYNGGTAQSPDVSGPGLARFPVGQVPVQVVAGGTEAPLPETRITLKEKLADGSLVWIQQGYTDGEGLIIFDPPGLGSGRVFLLEARSPWDNSTKRSHEITEAGGLTFVVGNAPLNVTLLDAISLEPLPGQSITAYERNADGGLSWRRSAKTDEAGRCTFDLEGLGDGRIYVLKTRPYSGSSIYSEDLESPGEYVFQVGTLAVTLMDGEADEAIPHAKIWAYERLSDGKLRSRSAAVTDENGVARFHLEGLDAEHPHVLRAKSPWDGSRKYSNALMGPGEFVFTIGSAPLFVTLKNGLSGEVLPGVSISARELFEDGSSRSIVTHKTDEKGQTVFDLDGLGDGRVYVLRAKPYAAGYVYTAPLTSAGEFDFNVGMLEVTVVDGEHGKPLMMTKITARERLEDGTLKWAKRGTTDKYGIVRFDLPGLGENRTYVLEAPSPLDGTKKDSDDIKENGRYRFVVGNAPLRMQMVNGLSGAPVPGVEVTAYKRVGEDDLQWVTRHTTDEEGRIVFDLEGLGEGSVYVLKAEPYNGGRVYSEEIREAGPYVFRVGTVRLLAISGADGEPLPGLTVTARVRHEDELEYVKRAVTDENGVILFDLPGLGDGAIYVFEANSPADGSRKYSQDIRKIGEHVFRVGNEPLRVTLVNGLHGNVLPGVRIKAYERIEGMDLRWVGERYTDESGKAVFDLDGLGDGRVYVLKCLPYNGDWVYSQDIDEPGPFDFRVGTVEVTVLSGADGSRLVNTKVTAREILEEGLEWAKSGYTDSEGMIRFDLPGLGDGRTYILEANSPTDGTRKYSEEIMAEGAFDFVVGNKPLLVTMVNGITGQPVVDVKVVVRELLVDLEESRWVRSGHTDEAGQVVFDIDGLGTGRIFVLQANPYGAGYVYAGPLLEPRPVLFRVGTVPVTLIDDDNDVPLVETKIIAYEKLPNGELRWAKHAYTDATGTIQFDLEGLSASIELTPAEEDLLAEYEENPTGRVYVFRAYNPFGEGGKFYSQLIDSEGPVEFRVSREGESPLDLDPPNITISSPLDATTVNADGFTVSGLAGDNVRVTQVVVAVAVQGGATTQIDATFDPLTGQWSASVTSNMVTSGVPTILTATASDQAQNQTSTSVSVVPMADSAPPQITITSHQNGDPVEKTGFQLGGLATDDIGVSSLVATLDDPVLGRTIDQQSVSVASDGSWALVVLNGQMTENAQIDINLVATDAIGNSASTSIQLTVVPVDFEVSHLINRITFGTTAPLLAQVEASGAAAYLQQQLDPSGVDDSAFDALIASLQPTTTAELQQYILLHATFSRRQLLEVMTQFWDNHFNTNIGTHDNVSYELNENDLFRQNALGRFRDLLGISAKSPAMLIYLDQASSVAGNPNENYPRELLELHTMSVDGGYTQTDVEEVARALTGWTVVGGQFFFDINTHDTGQKVVLGQTLPAGRGIEDGEDVLDIIAAHPSTATFLCTKLAAVFITDTPATALVDRCATAFLATGGEITPVLQTLLLAPEFGDAQNYRAKVKTPLEFVVGVARNLTATTDATDLASPMRDMGMNLLQNPVPTGWSETGDDWINSNLLLQRIRFVNRVARGSSSATSLQPRDFFLQNGQTTAEGITGFLFQLLFHHDFTALEYNAALGTLTAGGTQTFDINAADADDKLGNMIATVLSFPGYEYQ